MFQSVFNKARDSWSSNPGLFYQRALFWTFWFSLASFPMGYGAREVLPIIALIFLAGHYKYNWQSCTLARLPIRWIFLCPLLMSLIGILSSSDMWASLFHIGRGINKGFILPFIAMECATNEKDLRRLVWASAIACCWQGIDGIWQATTGFDFVFGYPMRAGRLTGSLGDYVVGNYIALALIPAMGLWHILRTKLSFPVSSFICCLLLAPAFFLLNGAGTRSGLLSLAIAFLLWFILSKAQISRKALMAGVGICLIFFVGFFGGQRLYNSQTDRFSLNVVSNDGRWGYWQTACKIVQANPWFGVGAGRFRATFEKMDIAPAKDAQNASHPHNLYLDILYAHGTVGFILGMTFLVGVLYWPYYHLKQHLRHENNPEQLFWKLSFCFWLGYLGWLVNGVFGHDFYRIWYLAIAMSYVGIILGATVNGCRQRPNSLATCH